MEARRGIAAKMAVGSLLVFVCLVTSVGDLPAASYETANFVIHAPSGELARQLGEAAEEFRQTLAVEWLGHELPKWEERCPVRARIARGAGGETSFCFTRGRVHGWRMSIQGSPKRMLDSVLPHEVTHTIFATHFRQPLPRWADEGACTTVEHPDEVARMERELIRFLKTRRGIRFSDMMWMKQYPRDFMPLYAQGHSVAKYLISLGGKQAFISFLEDGLRDDNWPRAVEKHYGFAHLSEMQNQWLQWVRAGRPMNHGKDAGPAYVAISNSSTGQQLEDGAVVVRGQDPQPEKPARAVATAIHQVALNDSERATEASRDDKTSPVLFQWRANKVEQ